MVFLALAVYQKPVKSSHWEGVEGPQSNGEEMLEVTEEGARCRERLATDLWAAKPKESDQGQQHWAM